ncbi:MAG TPA: hypothetical protein VHP37_08930 [Burkholderiales bacterium]|nr:hypothetical protein [Burkholderiales bacterium]
MAQSWQFTQDEQEQWRWTRIDDDRSTQSAAAFETQVDCFMDAIRHVVSARRPGSGGIDGGNQTH